MRTAAKAGPPGDLNTADRTQHHDSGDARELPRHRGRRLARLALIAMVASSVGCASRTSSSGPAPAPSVTSAITSVVAPSPATTPSLAVSASQIAPATGTLAPATSGRATEPASRAPSQPGTSASSAARPSITIKPIMGTGGYGCPGPGLPYLSFPTEAGAYATMLYEAWTAGNKEGICELVILSGTDPLMAGVHTSSGNYVPTSPFCQADPTYTYCTFYSTTMNATLFMRMLNSSLGGPHAVLQVSFHQGHYP